MNDPMKCYVNQNERLAEELRLELQDTQWPFNGTDHERTVARAIVFDDEGFFYFVRVDRDDEFGCCRLIESSGGGAEAGEEPADAVRRELREELGAEVELICKLGTVNDHYNLIRRRNLNHYFLCRVLSFGEKKLTEDEKSRFRLSTLKLCYEDAAREYERCSRSKLGALIAARELPVLRRAKELLDIGIAGPFPNMK